MPGPAAGQGQRSSEETAEQQPATSESQEMYIAPASGTPYTESGR